MEPPAPRGDPKDGKGTVGRVTVRGPEYYELEEALKQLVSLGEEADPYQKVVYMALVEAAARYAFGEWKIRKVILRVKEFDAAMRHTNEGSNPYARRVPFRELIHIPDNTDPFHEVVLLIFAEGIARYVLGEWDIGLLTKKFLEFDVMINSVRRG
jgi:hypothetical protein